MASNEVVKLKDEYYETVSKRNLLLEELEARAVLQEIDDYKSQVSEVCSWRRQTIVQMETEREKRERERERERERREKRNER